MTIATGSCCGGVLLAKLPGSVRWLADSSEAANEIVRGPHVLLWFYAERFLSVQLVGARTQQGGRKAEYKDGICVRGNWQGAGEGSCQAKSAGKRLRGRCCGP